MINVSNWKISNCVMYLHQSASQICAPIYSRLKISQNCYGLTTWIYNYEQSQKLHLGSHIGIHQRLHQKTFYQNQIIYIYSNSNKTNMAKSLLSTNPDLCLIQQKWCACVYQLSNIYEHEHMKVCLFYEQSSENRHNFKQEAWINKKADRIFHTLEHAYCQ